jgi:hypothetical protein
VSVLDYIIWVPFIIGGVIWLVWRGYCDIVGKVREPAFKDMKRPDAVIERETRRPTAGRTLLGAFLFGVPGAIVGHAWGKKTVETERVYKAVDPEDVE